MTIFETRRLLNSLQKLDHEFRTRRYPAVLEADEPREEEPAHAMSEEEYFLAEQSPSDRSFR